MFPQNPAFSNTLKNAPQEHYIYETHLSFRKNLAAVGGHLVAVGGHLAAVGGHLVAEGGHLVAEGGQGWSKVAQTTPEAPPDLVARY